MRHALLSAALIAVLASAPAMAMAQGLPAGGMTVDEVATWLHNAGYPAKLVTEKDGSTSITSSADGASFHIDMYDCNGTPRCSSLQFYAGFATHGAFNPTQMNQWNSGHRWARAYVDDVNDPWIDMDVDLSPGGTYDGLNDEFGIWRSALAGFRKFIHW